MSLFQSKIQKKLQNLSRVYLLDRVLCISPDRIRAEITQYKQHLDGQVSIQRQRIKQTLICLHYILVNHLQYGLDSFFVSIIMLCFVGFVD